MIQTDFSGLDFVTYFYTLRGLAFKSIRLIREYIKNQEKEDIRQDELKLVYR